MARMRWLTKNAILPDFAEVVGFLHCHGERATLMTQRYCTVVLCESALLGL
jgi:hypothetical protein